MTSGHVCRSSLARAIHDASAEALTRDTHLVDTSAALDGRTALVTGGGSGIGLGCARALVADGAAVVLAVRNTERLTDAAALLREEFPDATVEIVSCDVTDEDSVANACAAAGEVGGFSIVVANAGYGGASQFHLTTLEEWNGIIGTNLTGAFLTMKDAVPHLVANGGGTIVAVSSIAATATHRFMTPYTVSKAGLEMLVQQVADELGSSGVARMPCVQASCRPRPPRCWQASPTSMTTTWRRCRWVEPARSATLRRSSDSWLAPRAVGSPAPASQPTAAIICAAGRTSTRDEHAPPGRHRPAATHLTPLRCDTPV